MAKRLSRDDQGQEEAWTKGAIDAEPTFVETP